MNWNLGVVEEGDTWEYVSWLAGPFPHLWMRMCCLHYHCVGCMVLGLHVCRCVHV